MAADCATALSNADPRIGLFGGSFDPPHLGHLALARCARDQLQLHQLRWLPAGAPWQKAGQPITDGAHRVAMLQRLIGDEAGFAIDPRELCRTGPSYTIDTLMELTAEQPVAQWLLVIGQDQYARLHTWHRWHELVAGVTLAVAARDGQTPRASAELAAHPHRLQGLAVPRINIAARDIRAQCAAGQDISTLVGNDVAGYIARHALYRG